MLTKDSLSDFFTGISKLKILVIGDVMIDSYVWGSVERISPEAPVPVVTAHKRLNRLGGAANVALNIKALGATPILCSVIGQDENAKIFQQLLSENKMERTGIIQHKNRITTHKTRVISGHHQMLRIDEELNDCIAISETNILFSSIKNFIAKENINAIIFEDYDKGVITQELIQSVVAIANKKGIPTIVDPKKRNFTSYKNVTLIKPNLKELREGLRIDIDVSSEKSVTIAIDQLERLLKNQNTLLTLSEKGVMISSPDKKNKGRKRDFIPAHIRNIADVSGAGDTVISVAAMGVAMKMEPADMASLANLAGGLVCEDIGVVPINKELLFREAKKILLK